jgi:hypothetical protein
MLLWAAAEESEKARFACALCERLPFKIGGGTMARTPTKDIMTDDIIFKNRREQPPDGL